MKKQQSVEPCGQFQIINHRFLKTVKSEINKIDNVKTPLIQILINRIEYY